ncbi:flagellar hook-length control protein FliK [Micromonospora sp. NPDC049679]|uniref:flagellar hook-length control protein FliK n=1 Tax=Micromonospora sp. NPDC049679 TaxID=3155920 RepID=UPI0033CF4FDD
MTMPTMLSPSMRSGTPDAPATRCNTGGAGTTGEPGEAAPAADEFTAILAMLVTGGAGMTTVPAAAPDPAAGVAVTGATAAAIVPAPGVTAALPTATPTAAPAAADLPTTVPAVAPFTGAFTAAFTGQTLPGTQPAPADPDAPTVVPAGGPATPPPTATDVRPGAPTVLPGAGANIPLPAGFTPVSPVEPAATPHPAITLPPAAAGNGDPAGGDARGGQQSPATATDAALAPGTTAPDAGRGMLPPVAGANLATPTAETAPASVNPTAPMTLIAGAPPASAPVAAATTPATASAPPAPPATQIAMHVVPLRRDVDGVHRLTVHLHPEELGPVSLLAEIRDNGIHLQLAGATEAGRETLRGALTDLRRELQQAGFTNCSLDLRQDTPQGGHPFRQALAAPAHAEPGTALAAPAPLPAPAPASAGDGSGRRLDLHL